MKTSFSLLTAVALTAVTGCMTTPDQNAHRQAGGAVSIFHMLDTNNDGKVTYAEFDAGFADAMFATYNHDASGAITRADWNDIEKAHQSEAAASFRALDLNHDGKLTKAELNTHSKRRDAVVRRLFNSIDKDHKGYITEAEAKDFGVKRAADRDPANHP